MISIQYNASVGALWDDIGSGLQALTLWEGPTGPMVFARSGAQGGVVAITFDGAGVPQIADQRYFTEGEWASADGRFDVIDTVDGAVLTFGSVGTGQLIGYSISNTGFGQARILTGPQIAATRGSLATQTDNGFVISASQDGTLRSYQSGAGSTLSLRDSALETIATFHATPSALGSISVGGNAFVLIAERATGASGPGLSVYQVEDGTGLLTPQGALDTTTGLGLFPTPVGIAATDVSGRAYAVVASASDASDGAALTVLEVLDTGEITITDHILDGLPTRFGRASAISVAEYQGWSYVVVAGGDGGVSLFTLLPHGQLVHLETIISSDVAPLSDVADLQISVTANGLSILLVSEVRDEIRSLAVDLSNQGSVFEAQPAGQVLSGSGFDDLMAGGFGADSLSGGNGDDVLRDGRGEDTLTGGTGADRFVLDWDGARDVITDFSAVEDLLDFGLVPMLYSSDQITVTSQAWGALLAYRGEELELRSVAGTPLSAAQIFGAIDWSVDRPPLIVEREIFGGTGDDYLQGSDDPDTIDAAAGHDTVLGSDGDDLIYGRAGADLLEGGDGDDTIFGGDQYDTIVAGAGMDIVEGGNGADLIYLGLDSDVFSDNAQDGAAGADRVFGGWGNDTLLGGGGDDTLYGDGNADRIEGGVGNDHLFGGDHDDFLIADDGNDWVNGGQGSDLVYLGLGDDSFQDSVDQSGNDTVFGGWGADTLLGSGGDDVLHGDGGIDLIEGGAGADALYGGAQGDTLTAGEGRDTVYGGNGRDLVFLGTEADVFFDNDQAGVDGRDTVFGGWGNDTLNGGGGDDQLDGQGNDDHISAGDGRDTVWGGDGNDFVELNEGADLFIDSAESGATGRDTVYGGWGDDTITGGGGADSFFGNGGADSLTGGNANDTLHGQDGDDVLAGEAGDDWLYGGGGADQFVFAAGLSNDVIADFERGVDQVLINGALTGGGTIADLIATANLSAAGITVTFATGGSVLLAGETSLVGLEADFGFLV